MRWWLAIMLVLTMARPVSAQFEEDRKETKGSRLDHPTTERFQVGVRFKAAGTPCRNVHCTLPIPIEWPEQSVKVVDEDFTSGIGKVSYRVVSNTAKQMVFDIGDLAPQQEAHAIVTLEITRYTMLPPEDTSIFRIPKKVDTKLQAYLNPSPYIESRDTKIAKLAKELTADAESDWEKVEALYQWVTKNISYQHDDNIKGALRALRDKKGDCEELSALFIALCRARKVPARTVWVPEHCYSEFYLEDEDGKGYWFPCQSAGSKAFGCIQEERPILQKGDAFHDKDRPAERLRYLSEFLKSDGQPQSCEFIRKQAGS